MDIIESKAFHWKRILAIMLFMTLLSILLGRIPSGKSKMNEAAVEYSKKCPIYFENGMSLDSVSFVDPKYLNYYFSDRNGVLENFDSTKFVNGIKGVYQNKYSNSPFAEFLNHGYVLNMIFVQNSSPVFQLKLDSKSFEKNSPGK